MYIIWAALGIVFILYDLAKKSTLNLVFASSFLFCSIFAFKFPNKIFVQIAFFPLFCAIFYFLIKTVLKKESKDILKKQKLDDFEGKIALVTKDIGKTLSIDGIGLINYNGEMWSAKNVDDSEIKAGSKVEIVSRENLIMNVKAVKNAKN